MIKGKVDLVKKIAKYVFFFGIVFGGVAVAFMQAGGDVPTWISIEDGLVEVEGHVEIEKSFFCDSDIWFCEEEKIEICTSQFPEEDYIVVAKTDSGPHEWKTSATYCEGPQCEDLNGSMTLVADNEVDFSEYPARNDCKSYGEGARLPTEGELSCIYNNQSDFGGNFHTSGYYWSATEGSKTGAQTVYFSNGSTGASYKTLTGRRSRCVFGY